MIFRAFILAAAFVLLGCGGASGGGSPALENTGYGPADTYHLELVQVVDEIAASGQRFLVTEDRPTVQAKDWRRGQLPDRFPEVARAWNRRACDAGMIHVVFGLNWNVLPIRRQTDEWARDQFVFMAATYNPACTWLEPIVEPDEGDVAKARRWTGIAAEVWPGVLILPGAGAHWTEIPHDFVDRHPQSVAEAERLLSSGDPRLLVITDGGPFVHPPSVFDELAGLASLSRATGVPLILYADRWRGDHGAVIRLLGGAT